VLVAGLLWQKQPTKKTSVAPDDAQVLTSISDQPQVLEARLINRNRALLGVMLAIVARRALQPEADPAVLSALSSTVNGHYPYDWSEAQRGRAMARDVIEPLSLLLLTSSVSSEADTANRETSAASEMDPAAGEMPTSGYLME